MRLVHFQRTYCRFLLLLAALFDVFLIYKAKTGIAVILLLYLLLSVITFFLYRQDKIKAKNDEWRTPENNLHFFSLIGGWPGALIAQRLLHHKSRKKSFLVGFYVTVILNISAISFYSYSGSNFLNYDMLLHQFNDLNHKFSKNSQDKAKLNPKGTVYSWTNKEGKTVYSNEGFPPNGTYRNGKIEWR